LSIQHRPCDEHGKLLVIADSLAFIGPERVEPLTREYLYPNVSASLLGLRAEVVAQAGWTSRDAWWACINDPRVSAFLADPSTKAVLIGVGGMDQLPAWLPLWLRQSIPYIRPDGLRRFVRKWYLRLGHRVIRVLDGRFRHLSQPVTDHYLSQIVRSVRKQRPDVAVATITPGYYSPAVFPTRNHDAAVAGCHAWAAREGVALVDIEAITRRMHMADRGHRDGLHLDEQAHLEIGAAAAAALADVVGYAEPVRSTRLLARPR
jgi:hypothetical protein